MSSSGYKRLNNARAFSPRLPESNETQGAAKQQPRALPEKDPPRERPPDSPGTLQDSIQFASAHTFVEDTEGTVKLPVIRLGSRKGSVSVRYETSDVSAKAGVTYEPTSGELHFADGEDFQEIDVAVIQSTKWSPSLEFKVALIDPTGCRIDKYLDICHVKVLDVHVFPSDQFKPDFCTSAHPFKVAIKNDIFRSYLLFFHFTKLLFFYPGIMQRSIFRMLVDQIEMVYFLAGVWSSMYMVNVVFNLDEDVESRLLVPGNREHTAYLLGAIMFFGMVFLHVGDAIKLKLDGEGHIHVLLRHAVFRRYMSYNDSSRSMVNGSRMQMAMGADTEHVADAYMAFLGVFGCCLKIGAQCGLIIVKNPESAYLVCSLPVLVSVTLIIRDYFLMKIHGSSGEKLIMYGMIQDAASNHDMIADYSQNRNVNNGMEIELTRLRETRLPRGAYILNTHYMLKWLSPFCVLVYIVLSARLVLTKEMELGSFLAIIAVIKSMFEQCSHAYGEFRTVIGSFRALIRLGVLLNMDTGHKEAERYHHLRFESSLLAWRALRSSAAHSNYRIDSIPIRVVDMSFAYEGPPLFKDVNLCVQQGTLVAVCGPHGSGVQTLLHMLALKLHPATGYVELPTHLRVVHVSSHPMFLSVSPLYNLLFGVNDLTDVSPLGIAKIVNDLQMYKIEKLVLNDLKILEDHLEANTDAPEGAIPEDGSDGWIRRLNMVELAHLNLARALVMNPEVLVCQKPFKHYNASMVKPVISILRKHIRTRGYVFDAVSEERRPRTVFFSAAYVDQLEAADVCWKLQPRGAIDAGCTVVSCAPQDVEQ